MDNIYIVWINNRTIICQIDAPVPQGTLTLKNAAEVKSQVIPTPSRLIPNQIDFQEMFWVSSLVSESNKVVDLHIYPDIIVKVNLDDSIHMKYVNFFNQAGIVDVESPT